MTETREFPTAVIASLSSGILLCDSFSPVHEAAQYLMGRPIQTYGFANKGIWDEMRRMLAEQCPGLPTRDDILAKIEAEIGKTVRIRKG
jgi:hypothetical protein